MSETTWETTTASAAQTRSLGAVLGRLLQGGDFVALDGDLGAGKTTFCAGVGDGLEVDEPLRSPSYLLCHEAVGRHPVLHLDAYFRERLEGLLAEGLVERFDSATVVLVEWAERMGPWLPGNRLEVRLEGLEGHLGGLEGSPEDNDEGEAAGPRRVVLSARGARAEALIEALRTTWKSGQEA